MNDVAGGFTDTSLVTMDAMLAMGAMNSYLSFFAPIVTIACHRVSREAGVTVNIAAVECN
jgi:hypothetical protein